MVFIWFIHSIRFCMNDFGASIAYRFYWVMAIPYHRSVCFLFNLFFFCFSFWIVSSNEFSFVLNLKWTVLFGISIECFLWHTTCVGYFRKQFECFRKINWNEMKKEKKTVALLMIFFFFRFWKLIYHRFFHMFFAIVEIWIWIWIYTIRLFNHFHFTTNQYSMYVWYLGHVEITLH